MHIPSVFQLGFVTPIPKDPQKDQTNPSNYRGISLLSNISKLFEKVLLAKLQPSSISLNPLQGGFRSGYSPTHTAFVLQEAIQSIREGGKKAYVAMLDVKRPLTQSGTKGYLSNCTTRASLPVSGTP